MNELLTPYHCVDQIHDDEMGGVWVMYGGEEKYLEVYGGET